MGGGGVHSEVLFVERKAIWSTRHPTFSVDYAFSCRGLDLTHSKRSTPQWTPYVTAMQEIVNVDLGLGKFVMVEEMLFWFGIYHILME